MKTISTIILSIIANIDNIPISITNKVTKKESIIISLISTTLIVIICTLFCIFCQNYKFKHIEELSLLLLIAIGLKGFFEQNCKKTNIPDYNNSTLITTTLVLNNISLALTICKHLENIIYSGDMKRSLQDSSFDKVDVDWKGALNKIGQGAISRVIDLQTAMTPKAKILEIVSNIILILIGIIHLINKKR